MKITSLSPHCRVVIAALLISTAYDTEAGMRSATVTAEPDAAAIGAAELAIRPLKRAVPILIDLNAPSTDEMQAVTKSRIKSPGVVKPFQIGFRRDVSSQRINLSALQWQPTKSGHIAAQFRIHSATALGMRLGFSINGTKNAIVRFAGNDGRVFETANDKLNAGITWSPIIDGDMALVEIQLNSKNDLRRATMNIPMLSHLDISPLATNDEIGRAVAKIGESGECNEDIVCRKDPSEKFLAAEKAIARMAYVVEDGRSFICTGTLINNNFSPKRHMFWSAAHCLNTQAAADTLQTYWFYKSSGCKDNIQAPGAVTLAGGAFLRHENLTTDTLLLELKNAPPTGATYVGWFRRRINDLDRKIEGIHHPRGDVKKYSLGKVTNLSTSLDGRTPLTQVNWDLGTTEKGSSGSPLFTVTSKGDYKLRGGLYGGSASCEDPGAIDAYSQLSEVYDQVRPFLLRQ